MRVFFNFCKNGDAVMKFFFSSNLLNVMAGSLGLLMLAASPMASALAAMPKTGICGMLVTLPAPVGQNFSVAPTNKSSILATIDFSTNPLIIKLNAVTTDYATNPIPTVTGSSGFGSTTGTLTPLLGANVSQLTMLNGDTFNLVAVNGGNTILVQGNNKPFNGVCQF